MVTNTLAYHTIVKLPRQIIFKGLRAGIQQAFYNNFMIYLYNKVILAIKIQIDRGMGEIK